MAQHTRTDVHTRACAIVVLMLLETGHESGCGVAKYRAVSHQQDSPQRQTTA